MCLNGALDIITTNLLNHLVGYLGSSDIEFSSQFALSEIAIGSLFNFVVVYFMISDINICGGSLLVLKRLLSTCFKTTIIYTFIFIC